MNRCLFACAGLAFAAGSANAAIFSFQPDASDHAYVFSGNGANVAGATNGNANPIDLLIDDDIGPANPLTVSCSFVAQYTLSFVGSIPLPGGATSYAYAASGSFTFTDIASGTTLLTTNFSNALFTARGSSTAWFSTATLQVDDSGGATVSMVWGGANLPQYGLAPGSLNGSPRDFAFNMTVLNSNGTIPYNGSNPGVPIDASSKLPSQQWWTESSYAAEARTIPAPGAAALMGLGGLMLRRRRR